MQLFLIQSNNEVDLSSHLKIFFFLWYQQRYYMEDNHLRLEYSLLESPSRHNGYVMWILAKNLSQASTQQASVDCVKEKRSLQPGRNSLPLHITSQLHL